MTSATEVDKKSMGFCFSWLPLFNPNDKVFINSAEVFYVLGGSWCVFSVLCSAIMSDMLTLCGPDGGGVNKS